ncbi:hypothetical protein G1H11_21850 [Phytoactinopolyspora alkaliphila]|uniref:Uncharacterized protein n=1 Tax=Phytoactinopolyspora alkaliphila TaxID=1783498 RepID=A0A6N9YSN4_9ACTN|nr:hypothetical protein [Phytoactinopolyspora alkaliphila]NED97947.1 hypothetical protein [Phytoactinopolyspora alkaliphila]
MFSATRAHQTLVGQHLGHAEPTPPADQLIETLEPRLTCAISFATRLLPPEDRTRVNEEFDAEVWSSLSPSTQHAVHSLAAQLEGSWTVEELTGPRLFDPQAPARAVG